MYKVQFTKDNGHWKLEMVDWKSYIVNCKLYIVN